MTKWQSRQWTPPIIVKTRKWTNKINIVPHLQCVQWWGCEYLFFKLFRRCLLHYETLQSGRPTKSWICIKPLSFNEFVSDNLYLFRQGKRENISLPLLFWWWASLEIQLKLGTFFHIQVLQNYFIFESIFGSEKFIALNNTYSQSKIYPIESHKYLSESHISHFISQN